MTRREEILRAAVRLFRAQGIDGVGIDAIGAAVGVSGPALYRHFPGGKPELLDAAFEAAGSRLRAALGASSDDVTPEQRLAGVVENYVDVALSSSDLVGLYLDEADALPPRLRQRLTEVRRDHLGLWSSLLAEARPGLAPAHAELLARAAVAAVNAAVQRPSRLPRARRRDLLRALALDVLLATPTGRRGHAPARSPRGGPRA